MDVGYILTLVINGVTSGLLLALPALAVTLCMGIAKFPNIAIGDLMAVGGYSVLMLHNGFGWPFGVAVISGTVIAALISLLSYKLIFGPLARGSMVVSLLASTGLAFLLRSGVTVSAGVQPRTYNLAYYRPWELGGIRFFPFDLLIAAVGLVVLGIVFFILYRTPIGRQLRAVADNPALARASAINKYRLDIFLWTGFGLLAGLGGVLIGAHSVLVPEYGWNLLIPIFAAVILGGIGHPVGAVVGAVIMGIAQEVTVAFSNQGYGLLMGFVVMALVLLLKPSGLFGERLAVR